jgi:LPS O-antigen subunit length determinant protein (WzzB/FepE family)
MSNQEQNQLTQSPQYVMMPPQYLPQDDEINLADLWKVLVAKKFFIFGFTAIITLLAIVIVLIMPRTYQTTAHFLPPKASDLEELNIPAIGYSLGTEAAYNSFILNLKSRALRLEFFNEHDLSSKLSDDPTANKDQVFENSFNKLLVVKQDLKKKAQQAFVSISYDGKDPELIAKIVNDYIKYVHDKTIEEFLDLVKRNISIKKVDLEDVIIQSKKRVIAQRRQDEIERLIEADAIARLELLEKIKALKERTEQKRQDRIVTLEEALVIAKKLDIIDPIDSWSELGNAKDQAANKDISINTSINNKNLPEYTRGSKALEAELQALKARTSNDPFTPGLRELQEQLQRLEQNSRVEVLKVRTNDEPFIADLRDLKEQVAKLKNIEINEARIKAAMFDQMAVVPENPIKPKRKLIVMISFVLAFMLSIFLAFFFNFIEKSRAEEAV